MTAKHIFVSVGLVLLGQFVSNTNAVTWKDSSQGFPEDAFPNDSFPPSVYYYCRGVDANGQERTGTLTKGQTQCELVSSENDKVEKIDTFEVMVQEDGDDIDYKYYSDKTPVPENAIPCNDNESKECYLGESVYSDGLCSELAGKIFLDKKRILMSKKDAKVVCGSFFFLVNKKA